MKPNVFKLKIKLVPITSINRSPITLNYIELTCIEIFEKSGGMDFEKVGF